MTAAGKKTMITKQLLSCTYNDSIRIDDDDGSVVGGGGGYNNIVTKK